MKLLRVSADGRHLEHEDGSPFLWLFDTAWELLHRLTRDEIKHYLSRRAAQGFTGLCTVLLAELDGLRTPTPDGLLPLHDLDPRRPSEAYLERVDWTLTRAAELGLTVALLPMWGDKVMKWWGVGPELFAPRYRDQGLEAARASIHGFGMFLGERYRDRENLIWVLGGDRSSNGHTQHRAESGPGYAEVWRALGEGLRAGDGGRHLMTFHPSGANTSSEEPLVADLLDFHMMQTGHGHTEIHGWQRIGADRAKVPTKPVLDGEPCYEDMPVAFDPILGHYTDTEVRRAAYHALFAGAFGHTYGANAVWQMHAPPHPGELHARQTWRDALELPFAAQQMRHLRALLERGPLRDFAPDPPGVLEPGEGFGHVLGLRGPGRLWVYTPTGQPLTLSIEPSKGEPLRAVWFDPRNGSRVEVGSVVAGGQHPFIPPRAGVDWVLTLERG